MKKVVLVLTGLIASCVFITANAQTPGAYITFGGGYTDFNVIGYNVNYSTFNYGGGIGYLSPTIDQTPIFWGVEGDVNYNTLMLNLVGSGILGVQLGQRWSVYGKAGIAANYIAVISGLPSFTRPEVGGGVGFQATQHIRVTAEVNRMFLTHDIGYNNANINFQFTF